MGITEAALALPLRRVPEKALRRAGRARGFSSLRVPWFDEDALTLALDTGLALGDAVDRADRLVLVLDERHDQPVLTRHALGLEAPVDERVGPLAGLSVLADPPDGTTLVLAGGTGTGGAGVALVLEPGQGVEVDAVQPAAGAPLGEDAGAALSEAVAGLPDPGPLVVPAGTPGRRGLADAEARLTSGVGTVGASGALAELVDALHGASGPVRVAASAGDRALALATGGGSLEVSRAPGRQVDVDLDAVDRLDGEHGVAWSEASQGAYVSREDYDADPAARYGARALGEATVASVTTIQAGPPGEFLRQHEAAGPYDVAILEHDDGSRSIHQAAVPPGELAIGDTVTGVLRRLFSMEGTWRYAVKVRPA